jgi:polar amino acid transport system substrate-binding protein
MKATRLIALLGLLLPFYSNGSVAEGERLSFISIETAPWASRNETSGELEGAFVEIVRALAQRLEQEVDISIAPFARIERELASGVQDCTILVPLTEDIVQRGTVVAYHPIGFYAHKDIPLRTYEDIKPLKLSVIRGAAITPEFDNDTSLQKEFDTDYLIGLRKVARGRLDAIVGAIPTLKFLAEQEGLDGFLGKPLTVVEIPLVLQCGKTSKQIPNMPRLNTVLDAIKEDGTLEKIRSRYYF